MANRDYIQFQYQHEKKPVRLFARVNIGAAGAPTLQAWTPSSGGGGTYAAAVTGGYRGIKSITRNGTGDYTLTLQDAFQQMFDWDVAFIAATTLKAAAPLVSAFTTGTNVGTSTGGTFRFVCQSAQGTAADPASGEIMLIRLELGDSTSY